MLLKDCTHKSGITHERAETPSDQEPPKTIRVSILEGGIHEWINHWSLRNRLDDMVSNFDTGSWSACGPLMVHVMDALWTEGGQLELAKALEKLQAMSQVDSPQHVGSGKNTRSVGTPASQQTPKRRPSGESGHSNSLPKPESPCYLGGESIPEGETLLTQPENLSYSSLDNN